MIRADGIDVWSNPHWQEEALHWVDGQLHGYGISRRGVDPAPRIRSWAATFRLPTDHGDVWLKAASPATVHEIAVYPLLAESAPASVLNPLATDTSRGWILLPHGGSTLMHTVSRDALPRRLEVVVQDYARLQLALMPHVAGALAAGVPDMRPVLMPDRFNAAFEAIRQLARRFPKPGDEALLDRIAAFRPQCIAMCEELAVSPVPVSIDHGDLHANNILADVQGSPRIFDWGDSAIAHPFATMLEFFRFTGEALGVPQSDPVITRLRDSYLEVFGAYGSHGDLVRMVTVAREIGKISRALTYMRVMELGPLPDPAWNRIPIELVASLLDL